MKILLLYLLESSVCMTVLLMFYRYLYFKIAYFEWSRFFLLFAVLFSLILPALATPSYFLPKPENLGLIFSDGYILQRTTATGTNTFKALPYILIAAFSIWLAGFIFGSYKFYKSLLEIWTLSRNTVSAQIGNYSLYVSEKDIPTFSFFRRIFAGSSFTKLTAEQQQKVLAHEKQHGALLHSADRLFLELYKAFFWFNPYSKVLLMSMKEVHEFSADKKVTGNNFDESYAILLVRMASKNLLYPSAAGFSDNEQLKHRLQVIAEPENDRIRKRRFAASLPVLLTSIFALWLISSTVNATISNASHKEYSAPIHKTNYDAKLPYFENKSMKELFSKQEILKNDTLTISHQKIKYKTHSNSEILAAGNGKIISADTIDFQGLHEITIKLLLDDGTECIYEKLARIIVNQNSRVKSKQVIAFTGDSALYPFFIFKMKQNGQYINPEKYFSE